MDVRSEITRLAQAVQATVERLHEDAGGAVGGTSLDQAGLRDGCRIIEDYLDHNDIGEAFHHLLYVLSETRVTVTATQYCTIDAIGRSLGLPDSLWEQAIDAQSPVGE